MSKRGPSNFGYEQASKRVEIENKKPLTEAQFLREKVKRLEEQLRKKNVQIENNARWKTMVVQYKAKRAMEIKALTREKERWKNSLDHYKDSRLHNRIIDPCRSVCGWDVLSVNTSKEKLKEVKQFRKDSPEWDFNILPNAPASNSDVYIPKLIPSEHDARWFHWGMKDVFAINIYGKRTHDTVYRCAPLPKQYMRLRPRMIMYGKYTMNENDRLCMDMPVRVREWFSQTYVA